MGQEPVVGRMEGALLLVDFPEERKWVARQVRWVVLVQEFEGQIRVLAPDEGVGRQQRVQVWGVARSVRDFSRWGFRGRWVTSRA